MMDPVNLEIISNALSSIAEEMGEVLAARALSTGISQKRNYSTAIFTTGGFLAAVGDHVPVHLGPLHLLAQAVLKIHPLHSLSQGDSIITNDPYLRGFQPPWICMVSPVYHNHVPLAVVASIAHHSDAGGLVPGGMPTSSWEIYHEGIRIPPVKIVKKGQLDNNLALLISSNIRTPFEFTSDIKAQLSAAKFAGKRLNDLVVRYGTDKIKRYMTGIIDRTETRTRELLNILPAGIYTFEDFIEVDSQPGFTVNIRLTVSKDDDNLTFDFTGTHPQVEYPVNASRELTLSGVYYAVRSALCPEIPINDGFFRPIRAITPEGSLLNPGFPAPVALAGVNTAQRVTDTVFGCLASAIPERIEAAGTGSACSFTAGGIPSSGEEYYSLAETHGGGQGAKVSGDGMDGVGAGISNLMGTPVEIIERDFPLIINSSRLITDSGGPGKFRGGLGIQTIYTLLDRSTVTVSTDRNIREPWGLSGGLPGRAARVFIKKCSGHEQKVSTGKFTGILEKGCTVMIETAGGGGYGSPLERDPETVRDDVLEGYVSPEQAAEVYGVVLSGPGLRVDYRATEVKRAAIARKHTEKLSRQNPG